MLAFVLGRGRPRSSLRVDRSLKGSPQSWIADPCDVLFENGYSPRILECDDRLADFAACAAKEARRRWPPLVPERVDFIGHGKCSRSVFGIAGDGKTQEQQEPFADSAGPPILRNELLHLISCHLGDRLYFAAPRRNAEPRSCTVPASIRKPRLCSTVRSGRPVEGCNGSSQTISTPVR